MLKMLIGFIRVAAPHNFENLTNSWIILSSYTNLHASAQGSSSGNLGPIEFLLNANCNLHREIRCQTGASIQAMTPFPVIVM